MMIKLETHCHSAPASRCGKIGAEIIVPLLWEAGYSAVVLTNHYTYYDNLPHSNDEIFERTLADFDEMKRIGEGCGLKVFFGAELRFYGSANDYLLYGMTPDELFGMGEIYAMTPAEFWESKPSHVLIYQAHPFRDKMTRTDPRFLDGIEVYNGHPNHNARNESALEWAKESGKLMIAGSDTHFEAGLGRAGVYLKEMPENERELAAALRKIGEKDLICG